MWLQVLGWAALIALVVCAAVALVAFLLGVKKDLP